MFERFVKVGRVYQPWASLLSRGQLRFGKGALRQYGIDGYQYAVLFFDPEHYQIGVQFTNDPDERGATRIAKRRTGTSVSVKAFLNHYRIPHERTQKFHMHYDEQQKLYVIDLAEKPFQE